MPWSRYMLSMKSSATLLAMYGWRRGMKCAHFECLSTTTRMQSKRRDGGSLVMKSMVAISHGPEGTGNG